MSEYIAILLWLGFMLFISKQRGLKKTELVCGVSVKRYPWWFAVAVFAPVIWMAGHRSFWFADTYLYRRAFLIMPNRFGAIPLYISAIEKDKGYYFFVTMLKQLIGNDVTLYLTIMATIQGIVLVLIYRKYSTSYCVSVFLFLASADYISWMYNGIRQFTAVTIIFAATPLMLKKKKIAVIIVILLAAQFHQSALIMLPFALIAQGKAWNKNTVFLIFIAVVFAVIMGQDTALLGETLADTQYKNVVRDFTEIGDDGTNPIRVLVYSIPAVLSFFFRKKIKCIDDPVINLSTNMSIVSAGLYVASMVTSGVYVGRLPIYTSLYSYILLPWEIEHFFKKNSVKLMKLCLIGTYLLFYYYQMHFVFALF